MYQRLATTLSLTFLILGGTETHAVEQMKTVGKPALVKIGTTVFVRGSSLNWAIPLNDAVPNPRREALYREYLKSDPVKRIVFVNIDTTERIEGVEWAAFVRPLIRAANIETVVVGKCNQSCAKYFLGGVNRLAATGAYIELQAPIAGATMKAEIRFPATQVAAYEEFAPGTIAFKHIFIEAFSKGGDKGMLGGTRFYANQKTQFCEDWAMENSCKNYNENATQIGLLTSAEPVNIELPEGW